MKKMLLIAAAVSALSVSACSSADVATSPQLTFQNYETVMLNVQAVRVEENYIQPNDPKNVASQFVVSPADAVKRYAAKRFQAGGAGDGAFTITIEDARVHMRQITENNKVLEWSGVGTDDEYRIFLQLVVSPQPSGFSGRPGATTIRMDRTLVMPSSVTLAEREMRQIQFLERMIADVDSRVTDVLNASPALRQ
jgi:hypothetical protein